MTEVVNVTLENEMDLILAYKKSIKLGEMIGLTISTQTAFATAVSEVCREVIDKTFDGRLQLGIIYQDSRYAIAANICFSLADSLRMLSEGFEYARKLVPEFILSSHDDQHGVLLKLGIPRTARLTNARVNEVKRNFDNDDNLTPYEEIKRRNKQLDELNEQRRTALVQAQHLNELKDEFLSVASHELNTPLTILKSYTQLAMRAEGGQNPQLHNYLKKIEAQSAKLNMLIQQLLDVSKIELGQVNYNKEVIQLNDFINNATELTRLLVPGHQISLFLDADTNVYIDRLRMEQVLNNLIGNAAKYSPSGTEVNVTTKLNGLKVNIAVKDQGIGMSAETISNVFNKFYRGDNVMRKYNGLGMGLYIASKIVADHDSEITVESEEGKGSTFSFSLPLCQ